MGVTIAYRGRLSDASRGVDIERVFTRVAESLDAEAQIWSSASDADRTRVVRGVILKLHPEMDTVSLLFSPEGWLLPLNEIQEAEEGRVDEPPWVFVKTQFAPIEGHLTLVELLTALKEGFVPDLEVEDDSEYWSTRNIADLHRAREQINAAMESLEV
jgi:hypothetical protein